MNPITLETGKVSITLAEGVSHDADLLEMKLICQEAERKHKLQVDQETQTVTPTLDFLRELAAELKSKCGLPECSVTQANQIWVIVNMQFAELNQRIHSKINENLTSN
ncbi:MAG: hypothetical protein AAFP69_23825 [Planctomycetota bacterium]